MATSTSDRKIIIAKDRLEFYSFNNFYQYGKTDRPKPLKTEKKFNPRDIYESDERKQERIDSYRMQNRIRSQQNLVRLVNANKTYDRGRHSLLTLTYKEDVRDISRAQRDLAKFIQRLNYYLLIEKNLQPLRYIGVIEFQDKSRNGVIHFHLILFDVPYLHWENITKMWSHGSVDIVARDRRGRVMTVTQVAHYMGKYMAKHFTDTRLNGKKKYFGSRNLERPIVLREPSHVDFLKDNLNHGWVVYSKNYTSKFMGASLYVVYENVPLELVQSLLAQPPPVPRYLDTEYF